IPTETLTPRGGLSGVGKPATPAGPNSQSGIAMPGCLTNGVNNSGTSFSSILFLSISRGGLLPLQSSLRQLRNAGTVSRRQHRWCGARSPTHTAIDKAELIHLRCFINVTPIDQHGAPHGTANLWHVQRFEFVPLRHHHQRVGV